MEVDISKPLLSMFELKDKSYRVEFEGLHLLCITCGKFGHYKEGCHLKKSMESTASNTRDQGAKVDVAPNGRGKTDQRENDGDGPWHVVQKQRRNKKPPEVKSRRRLDRSWLGLELGFRYCKTKVIQIRKILMWQTKIMMRKL